MKSTRALGAIMASIAMAAVMSPVSSAKPGSRTVELEYSNPVVGTSVQPPTSACISIDPADDCPLVAKAGKGERFLSVSIEDDAGQVVSAAFEQEASGALEWVCGATTTPIRIAPNRPVNIYVYAVGDAGCPGASTTGSVELSFSKNL